MRIVFLGSPAAVVPILHTLLEAGPAKGHQLIGVVSQPAKPAGRSGSIQDPPVAIWAKQCSIPLLQPESARDEAFLESVRAWAPDVCLTAAYGQILNEAFLSIPQRATINIHPSLLPAYRGAIPVQAALLSGAAETGVSILFTVKKLDAGALICQRRFGIAAEETADQLLGRLFIEGAPMIFEALDLLKDPDFVGTPQDDSQVSHCRKITKEEGEVNWAEPGRQIFNRFRAYQPWPGCFSFLGEKRVSFLDMSLPKADQTRAGKMNAPGSFFFNKASKAIEACTGDGSVLISRLLPASGKAQDAASFWNGLKSKEGAFFGKPSGNLPDTL